MKKFVLNCFGILLSILSYTQDGAYDLMPLMQHMKSTADRFRITKCFNMGVTGSPGDRVYKEATRSLRRLANGNDTKALEIPLDVIEPLKIYQRNA